MSGAQRLDRHAADRHAIAVDDPETLARALWRSRRLPGQTPPDAPWRTWVFMGGRGAGKTRAGAEWIAARAADPAARVALVGPTLHDVREVMIGGPSGLAHLPVRHRPRYEPSRRRLRFPSGAVGYAFSAEDPDSLRGPQFDTAWADELCTWRRPGETLSILRMGLRLGPDPRLVVTTTPRPSGALRRLLAEPGCVRTHARTADNPHLSQAMRDHVLALYGGTRVAAQELDGVLLESEGALWRVEDLLAARGAPPDAPFDRVVVAVDPAITPDGDACGIVVAGRIGDHAWVLADLSSRGLSPTVWAARVASAAREHRANAIVAEANQGGDLVKAILAQAAPPCSVRLVHALKGKTERALPVAALYEQRRITHCAPFPLLEEELLTLGAPDPGPDDRADALVWAITDLLVGPRREGPRITVL